MTVRVLEENYYELAEINWLIKTGIIDWKPPIHNKPEFYGLKEPEAIKMRIRHLQASKRLWQADLSDKKGQFLRGEVKDCYQTMNYLQDEITKVEKAIYFNKQRLRGEVVNQPFDLTVLKQIPIPKITEILPNNFFKVNPFRQENSPSNSLFYYKAQNRAQDFGTSKSYDAIDVYMAVNQCDFKTACKEMQSL
jgi:hypothetical protein